MALVDSNTYIEPTAGTSLNAARSQFNNSLRSLLTNFQSSSAPDTVNITASGSGITVPDGTLYRHANSNVTALYISDSTNVKDAPVSGNFTRVGIGNRVENGIASMMSNVTHYEIGELVATVSADVALASNARLYLNKSNNNTDADFIDVGIPPNDSVVNTMIAISGVTVDRVNFTGVTSGSFDGVNDWEANTTLKLSAESGNTSLGLGTLNNGNVALVHRTDAAAVSALNGLHVLKTPGNYANVAVASLAVNSIENDSDSTPAILIPAGSIIGWGASSPPTGWLSCDGSAISRTTYASLFAAIGTSFGSGDGSTTFNIPNYEDKLVMGAGSNNAVGDSVGSFRAAGAATTDSTAASISAPTATFATSAKDSSQSTAVTSVTASGHTHTITIPNTTIRMIIKT